MASVKGRQLQVGLLVSPEMLAEIDELARMEELSRADILRRLLRRGLEMERLIKQPESMRKR